MDYVTIHKLVKASGYKKVTTENILLSFTTNYLKGNDRIQVKWEMGGYVKEVTHTDNMGQKKIFETAEQFITTFA
jgi:hypothetical protein